MHVKSLSDNDRAKVRQLFTSLDERDRTMRFCSSVAPETVERYVGSIDFSRGVYQGVFTKEEDLVAVSELVGPPNGDMEFAIVVAPNSRGIGICGQLLSLARKTAEEIGARALRINCLASNRHMVNAACAAGIPMHQEHGEMEGCLRFGAA